MAAIEQGKVYVAKNQGRAITPMDLEVEVAWVDENDVWYRFVGRASHVIYTTPLARFKQICGVL